MLFRISWFSVLVNLLSVINKCDMATNGYGFVVEVPINQPSISTIMTILFGHRTEGYLAKHILRIYMYIKYCIQQQTQLSWWPWKLVHQHIRHVGKNLDLINEWVFHLCNHITHSSDHYKIIIESSCNTY